MIPVWLGVMMMLFGGASVFFFLWSLQVADMTVHNAEQRFTRAFTRWSMVFVGIALAVVPWLIYWWRTVYVL